MREAGVKFRAQRKAGWCLARKESSISHQRWGGEELPGKSERRGRVWQATRKVKVEGAGSPGAGPQLAAGLQSQKPGFSAVLLQPPLVLPRRQ